MPRLLPEVKNMDIRHITLFLALALLLCATAAAAGEEAQGGEVTVPVLDNPRAYDIPDNEAMAFLRQMGAGWNLGNTFDAYRDGVAGDEMRIESYWCGVQTTERMIETVRAAGFTTLRVPVSWHNHVDAEFNISDPWLDRVQQVVDWGIAQDMTVIINTHHDEYPEYLYPSEACYETSERYIRRVWEQLAARFVDYGEKLVFEAMNEPRQKGTDWEWWLDEGNPACREAADCINRLNQVFVDAVRAAGGENAGRYLMVPGYDASPRGALSELFVLPGDGADNRIIVSVHAYTPYSFALQEDGIDRFSLAAGQQTGEIGSFMNDLYNRFISRGIPVVIGEFGARDRDGNTQARVDYAAYYASAASSRGIPCCWWDNNCFSGRGERFGLLKRSDCTWPYPRIVEALVKYGGTGR